VAKATRKRKASRTSSTEQQTDIRISVHEAGTLLLKHYGKLHEARESLDNGIRRGVVRLWADGEGGEGLVPPDLFASHLFVKVTPDGRFEIGMTRGAVPCVYTISRASVMALIEQLEKPTGNPRGAGRKPVHEPEFVIVEAWAHVIEEGLPLSLEALCHALRTKHGKKVPKVSQCKDILAQNWRIMEQAHRRR
jgi:hypothetical protein